MNVRAGNWLQADGVRENLDDMLKATMINAVEGLYLAEMQEKDGIGR